MIILKCIVGCLIMILLFGGQAFAKNGTFRVYKNSNSIITDVSDSLRISGYSVISKVFFDINDILKTGRDTLSIVSCSPFVFYTFRKFKSPSGFKSNLLKKFSVTNRTLNTDIGKITYKVLRYKSSKLIFYFDKDPEASAHSNIMKADIIDADVVFDKGVHTGMSQTEFLNIFFDKFPAQKRYKVVRFSSCIDGTEHIYRFNNDKLLSISILDDTYWKFTY